MQLATGPWRINTQVCRGHLCCASALHCTLQFRRWTGIYRNIILSVLAKVASRALCVHAFRNTSALVRISLNRFRYFQFVVSLSSSHVFKLESSTHHNMANAWNVISFLVFANHIASTTIRMQVKDYHFSLVPFVAISLRCCLYS